MTSKVSKRKWQWGKEGDGLHLIVHHAPNLQWFPCLLTLSKWEAGPECPVNEIFL